MKRNPWKLNALDIPTRKEEEYEKFYQDIVEHAEQIKRDMEG